MLLPVPDLDPVAEAAFVATAAPAATALQTVFAWCVEYDNTGTDDEVAAWGLWAEAQAAYARCYAAATGGALLPPIVWPAHPLEVG